MNKRSVIDNIEEKYSTILILHIEHIRIQKKTVKKAKTNEKKNLVGTYILHIDNLMYLN